MKKSGDPLGIMKEAVMFEESEPLRDYYHQVIEGNHISSLLSLIILVGTQNASHRKKLKTDFTTCPRLAVSGA